MPEIYETRPQEVEVRKVTEDNLEEVELWCMGSIKGTMLPRKDRVIDIWNTFLDTDQRAEMADYIIHNKEHNYYEVVPNKVFDKLYRFVRVVK